jgi:hypothetical protein
VRPVARPSEPAAGLTGAAAQRVARKELQRLERQLARIGDREAGLTTDVLTKNGLHLPTGAVIVGAAGNVLAATITVPVTAGVLVLLYIDLRMRKEGLDLALQTASQGKSATGRESATLWRPPASPGQFPGYAPPGYGTDPG